MKAQRVAARRNVFIQIVYLKKGFAKIIGLISQTSCRKPTLHMYYRHPLKMTSYVLVFQQACTTGHCFTV